MYHPRPNQNYVPVYQAAQSLISGGTNPPWQTPAQQGQQPPRLAHAALPVPAQYPGYQPQPQLQPQQSLLPVYHHGSIQTTAAGGVAAPTAVPAAPSPSASALGHGPNIFGTPSGHSMPTAPNQESPSYVKAAQTSPEEKNSGASTPGCGTPSGDDSTAFVLQLSSRDFYSPMIQQFLGKRTVQIDDAPQQSAPATPATPVSPPTVSVKSEPDITPQEVTVKQPSSKRALHLDEPFVPRDIKKEVNSDDDLIIVDHDDVPQPITPPPKMTAAQAGGKRLTDG